jgi:hypothetical protein
VPHSVQSYHVYCHSAISNVCLTYLKRINYTNTRFLTVTQSHNITDWEKLSKKSRNKFIMCAQGATCLAQTVLGSCSLLWSILHTSNLQSPEQWIKFTICMGRAEFKKIAVDGRGSLIQSSKFHVFSRLHNWGRRGEKKLAGRKCCLLHDEENLSGGVWHLPHWRG